MKAIVICTSVAHGQTRKLADAIAPVLDAHVVTPDEIDATDLAQYDVVGFGSGIYNLNFHKDLRAFVERLPDGQTGAAFVFATSGLPENGLFRYTRALTRKIEAKGYDVVDTFSTRGWDTYGPFKLVGGIRKGHPDAADLDAARDWATSLRGRIEAGADLAD